MMLSTSFKSAFPAALQLVGYASAAQRTADESGLVPHGLGRLLRPEDRLAIG
jgi:hypothetical protein